MSEEIRELTEEEKSAKEALDQKLAKCETEEEVYEIVMCELMPGADELGETDLDLVVGGRMSTSQAVLIVSTAYVELCVRRKRSCAYSTKQINEAMKICDKSISAKVLAIILGAVKSLTL